MAKLQFVLTFYWWNKVAAGEKTSEYRRFCPGWSKRLARLKKGDEIILRRGYTDRTLTRRVECVRVVNRRDLPAKVRDFFSAHNENQFFEIVFQKEENV